MKRRKFIALAVGAAAGWPLAARAQQTAMPVVGVLYPGWPAALTHLIAAFRAGLSETGFVEGQNVRIEYRFAEGQYDRLPDLAADLVRKGLTVLVTATPPLRARRKPQPPRSPFCSPSPTTRSSSASLPASTGQAAT